MTAKATSEPLPENPVKPAMTEEEKRIAIAKAVGWIIPDGCTNWRIRPDGRRVLFNPLNEEDPVPDFLNDLNAMHQAEKACLQQLIKGRYWLKLMEQEVPIPIEGENRSELVGHWTLTARQRADAFLKTIQP